MDLAQHVEVPPAVNQMETHVFNQQADNRAWYAKYDTALESWGPLAQGRNNIFTHPVLTAVGEKYGKTAAQVALRYLIQLDIIVIPKTVHRERMVTNLDVTDFQLDDADHAGPSPPSTRGKASSTTTTPPSRSASPPTRSRRTDLRLPAAASGGDVRRVRVRPVPGGDVRRRRGQESCTRTRGMSPARMKRCPAVASGGAEPRVSVRRRATDW